VKLVDVIKESPAILMFHHSSRFRSGSEPEDFDEQLAKMMIVQMEIFHRGNTITCEGGLFEKGYSVKHK
jgi:hypothetical protein